MALLAIAQAMFLLLVGWTLGALAVLSLLVGYLLAFAYGFWAGAGAAAFHLIGERVARDFAVARAVEVIGGKIQAGEVGQADDDCVLLYTALRSGGEIERTKEGDVRVVVGAAPPPTAGLN